MTSPAAADATMIAQICLVTGGTSIARNRRCKVQLAVKFLSYTSHWRMCSQRVRCHCYISLHNSSCIMGSCNMNSSSCYQNMNSLQSSNCCDRNSQMHVTSIGTQRAETVIIFSQSLELARRAAHDNAVANL